MIQTVSFFFLPMNWYFILSSLLFLLGLFPFYLFFTVQKLQFHNWVFYKKQIVFFVLFSLFNCLYGVLYKDIMVFFFREVGLLLLVFLHIYYKEEVSTISKEDSDLRTLLEKKYPLLRFETPLMLLAFMGLVFNLNFSFYDELLIFCVFNNFIGICYCFFVFYHILCVLRTPNVLVHYNVVKAIRKKGVLSFSTAAATLNVCKLCGKGVVGAVGLTWLGPSFLHGDPFYRGSWWNELTYPYTGLKAVSSIHMMNANHHLSYYPQDKALLNYVNGPYKGYIDPLALKKMAEERNLPLLLPISMEHKIKLPGAGWWPFSKK